MERHQGAGSFFVVREIWIWIVGLGRGSGARRGRARGLPTFFTCPYSLSLSSPNIDISHDPPSSDATGVTAVWRPPEPRGSFSPVLSAARGPARLPDPLRDRWFSRSNLPTGAARITTDRPGVKEPSSS